MARFVDFILFLILLVASINLLVSEARPLNILKIQGLGFDSNEKGTFDWLSMGGIKDGPSPGVGHKFTNSQTLGGIKAGPSPGVGHKIVTGNHQ
ncbi:PAMP-induced secreted peptide 2 [Solanum stenotomum]|uniref:PAMP-induced secreted peptide 2 n=1 Tax=Solanum stenotomum TaxID=172797 RepID=UPI0020D15183|nr:PAMP-induced secreted peptide 2 [Solanum stenotomum]